ncbi:MarR family transcriptional regulator [Granulosicoccaceae sp. 1_MG-2023]|nr:MarR family transcriptional regulator [Granulosicoccaceae sp. 1_MG-2023]
MVSERSPGQDEAIDFGVLHNSLGYLLRRAQLRLFQQYQQTFAETAIRPTQFAVLELVAVNPGLSQSAVAQALSIQRTNMVGLLDALQKRKLIERRPSPQDRRTHALYLTDEGHSLRNSMLADFIRIDSSLVSVVGDENLSAMREGLSRIIDSDIS